METFTETIRTQKQKDFWRESEKWQRFSPEVPSKSVDDLLSSVPPGTFDDAEEDYEQFADKVSLVNGNKMGTGPIRHIDINGVCYHGLNNTSTDVEKNDSRHFSNAKDRTARDFKHCIFQAERYKDNPIHEQWDTNSAQQFCSNCILDKILSKGRSKVKVYRCLGH